MAGHENGNGKQSEASKRANFLLGIIYGATERAITTPDTSLFSEQMVSPQVIDSAKGFRISPSHCPFPGGKLAGGNGGEG
jgi:hypothetical protein